MNGLRLTSAGGLVVDGSASTQPVQGVGSFIVTQGTASLLNATVTGTVNLAAVSTSITTWTSATTLNTTANIYGTSTASYSTISGQISQTTTITAGAITFEESFDGGATFKTIPTGRFFDPATGAPLANPYTCVASTNQAFQIVPSGATQVRARLSTVITGTGSVALYSDTQAAATAAMVSQINPANLNATVLISQGGNNANVTAANALKVDGSAVTQPVSGVFWQTTQPVSGTVVVTQSTASNLQATVTGTVAATQSGTWNITNVSGTISLPTGAATSANQPSNAAAASTTSGQTGNLSLGAVTTGSPSYTTATSNFLSLTTAGALRVDGSAVTQPVSGTFWQATQPISAASLPLPSGASTSANQPTNAAQASTTSGQTGTLALAAVVSGTSSYTTATSQPLNLDTSGNLKVNIVAGGGGGGTSSSFNATFPSTGTAAGGEYLSSPPTLTSGQMVALQTNVNGSLKVDGSAVTQPVSGTFWQATQPVSGTVTANQGGAPWTVNPGTAANWGIGSSTQNTASVANGQLVLGQYNLSPASITSTNMSPLQLDSVGNLRITINNTNAVVAVSQSGSFNVGQVGTWTVQPGNTANTTAWLVTGTGGTFPITAASLPLPSGASTAANQTNIQGVIGAATAPASMALAGGVYNSTQPTLTTGQSAALQLDASGNLRVNVMAGGGGGGGTSSSFGAAFPTTGTAAGGEYLSSPPTLTSGQMVALQTNVNGSLKVDGSAVTQPVSGTFWQTTQPVSGTVTANIGTSGSLALAANQPTAATSGSTTSGQTGNMCLGAVTTGAPAYTTATSNWLSLTTAGALRVDGSAVTQP